MLRSILFTTVGLLCGVALTVAATTFGSQIEYNAVLHSQSDRPSVARKEVEKAIEHFRQAMVERRADWILSDTDSHLTFGHSNGVVQTREEFAKVVSSGAEIFKRVDITNRRLTVSGNTAIERHHFSADIIYNGRLRNFELEVVEVWQKSDRWRLIARQASKI